MPSREILTEEQKTPTLDQRQPPEGGEALGELADKVKGIFSAQAAQGHVTRIRAWEERVRQACQARPSEA